MTKAELTENILNHITDPWTDCCENYEDAELIDLEYAKVMIDDCREMDEDYEPEDRLPAEVTPELIMEVYNCHVRHMKHELHVKRLAELLTENEDVCLHNNFFRNYENNDPEVVPCDFLQDEHFYFDGTVGDALWYYDLFKNSRKTFDPDRHTYCWYDKEKHQLFSSDTPFADGVIDAEALARYILSPEGADAKEELLGYISDEDAEKIFGEKMEDA